jgi:peroxiredoxin
MARTPSNMLDLGTIAPDFNLLDTKSDAFKNLNTLKGEKATVIAFICNHCPFVVHVNSKLVKIANTYQDKGIKFIAISSNDAVNYPQDGPVNMKIHAQENQYPFVYLYDKTQEVAKAYDAACTPDFYLFDKDLKLVYRGQLDSSRPENGIPVTGEDLKYAMDCLLENKSNTKLQKPSIGCNIKWKS